LPPDLPESPKSSGSPSFLPQGSSAPAKPDEPGITRPKAD
jgi:hypothetical protein